MRDRDAVRTAAHDVAAANDGIEYVRDNADIAYVTGVLAALTWTLGYRDTLPATLDELVRR